MFYILEFNKASLGALVLQDVCSIVIVLIWFTLFVWFFNFILCLPTIPKDYKMNRNDIFKELKLLNSKDLLGKLFLKK